MMPGVWVSCRKTAFFLFLLTRLAIWRAEAVAPDSAQIWLAKGVAAREVRQLPTAYFLFEQAASASGTDGLAARLARIQLLISLRANTAARLQLRALPTIPVKQPWLQVARQQAELDVLPSDADAAVRLGQARRLIGSVTALTPLHHPRRAQAWLTLAEQWYLLGQTDSARHYCQYALRLLRLANAEAAEPLLQQVALTPLRRLSFYTLTGRVEIRRADQAAAQADGAGLESCSRTAAAYLDTALQCAFDSATRARVRHLQALNLSNWATATEGPAGDRLAARAETCMAQALRLNPRPDQQLETLALQAQLADRFGEPLRALQLFQRALYQIAPTTDVAHPLSLPASFGSSYRVDKLLYVLEEKAAVCRELYEETGRLEYQLAYHAHAARIAEVLAFHRRLATLGYAPAEAALRANRPQENYALAVASGLSLYERTRERRYLTEAFRLTESVKAWRLLLRLGSDRPTDLLRADNQLLSVWRRRTEALQQWRELSFVTQEYPRLRKAASLRAPTDSLQAAERRLDALTDLLRTRYPTLYARANGDGYALPIAQIRQTLPADGSEAAVEFLRRTAHEDGTGREWVYAFVIRPDTTLLLQLPLPRGFADSVQTFTAALARPGSPAYPRLAHQLYQWLLAPVTRALPTSVKHLIVAPDGELWRVPFEALLTAPAQSKSVDYRRLPYVLRRWQISYAHSLTLYATGQARPVTSSPAQLLALAPFVDPTDPRGLPFTARLLDDLANTTAGDYRRGTTATTAAFRAEAAGVPVLHLATHAAPDLADVRASYLQLADSRLTLADLFDLQLHPQLVVLSACQTGVGRLAASSEGLTSLSWGFAYMGAASTIATLWRVDDAATARLLRRFYADLHRKHSRGAALHRAKLAVLDSSQTSEAADPFYWAGLVLTGDARPLPLAGPTTGLPAAARLALLGALSGVLLLSGVWWWFAKRFRETT